MKTQSAQFMVLYIFPFVVIGRLFKIVCLITFLLEMWLNSREKQTMVRLCNLVIFKTSLFLNFQHLGNYNILTAKNICITF